LRAASLVVLVTIVLPLVLSQFWAYQLGLYGLYAAAAVGVGLCWGQAGFLPLGQGLFFGLSAYLSGLAFIAFQDHLLIAVVALPLAVLVAGLLAYLIGVVVFRRPDQSGAYFSMITLALCLLAFQIATSWNSVTGGFNGLKGIPGIPGLDDFSDVYYVSATILLAVLAFGGWLYIAPIGVLWRALAQNERRLQLFGFNTNQLKSVAFGVSGLMAGMGGAIYAPQQGLVTPQVVGFGLSADLVIWAAVGGRASLLGPVIGTLVVGSLTAQLRDTLPFWEVLMALFFIAIVLVFPKGIAGLAEPFARFLKARTDRAALTAPKSPTDKPPARLTIEGIGVHIGEVTILDQLSLDFEQAGVFCVIGPNGAGKTSMFNVVSGELAAASGRIDLGGSDIVGLPSHRVSSLGVARKLQIPSVFPELSIADNLAIALWSGRAAKLQLLDPRLRRWTSPMLQELQSRYPFLGSAERKAAALSHGEQQILELAMALLTEPRVLLLDEPCAGLSPAETAAVMEIVRWAARRLGGAIIIIEHDMSLVKELAEVVYVLHNGTLLAKGSVAAIQADPKVRAVYVGGEK
jgi:ABC-type branched-subunit amino acid transport system ATPase component/ABC-type branched-subunit amino acid transport system permease subunit